MSSPSMLTRRFHQRVELTIGQKKNTVDSLVDRSSLKKLNEFRIPHPSLYEKKRSLVTKLREQQGWPLSHRVVIVDRYCGESVLRGADIFVKGILVADTGVRAGEHVAVYAHISDNTNKNQHHDKSVQYEQCNVTTRGMSLSLYSGYCIFLGMGQSLCDRSQFFSQSFGVGVQMSVHPYELARPVLPPLNTISTKLRLYPQNLPSVLVGHALDPQPHDCIFDMCGAPGGKTSHLALRSRGSAVVVMSDKSRKKVLAAKSFFEELGYAHCIFPLHLDATKCVERENSRNDNAREQIPVRRCIQEILSKAIQSKEDGLVDVKRFPPESFDKILLDPPCSALGLRPKLGVQQTKERDLVSFANYQKRFIGEAVDLLRPDGVMTFSTCSIHALENEANVRFLLDEHPCMELLPIDTLKGCGEPGLAGFGLSDMERNCVRRFDSFFHSDGQCHHYDCMGFFIAKFRKKKISA